MAALTRLYNKKWAKKKDYAVQLKEHSLNGIFVLIAELENIKVGNRFLLGQPGLKL